MPLPNPTSTKPVATSIGLLLWAILICLTIPAPGHAQVAEICTNGIDDDGDTLIDCDDPDCNFPLFSDGSYGDSQSFGVALGDLDGDGDLDAWVANLNQANRVWINQGGDQGGTDHQTESAEEFSKIGMQFVFHGDSVSQTGIK